MSKVPNSTCVPENLDHQLHVSPRSLESHKNKNHESVFDESSASSQQDVSFDSDTSGIYFPPSTKKSNNFRYSGDNEYSSDENSFKIGETELSVELDSLVNEHVQRSPYLLRSSLSRSSSLEPSTSGETEGSADTSTDEAKSSDVKKRRRSLGPKDFPKGPLTNNESGNVFTKMFKPLEPATSTFPLQPIEEFDEGAAGENRLIESDQFPIDDEQHIEITSKADVEDPYVLNINVHIPKEFSDKDIPVIVNINKQSDYSYQEVDEGAVSNNVSSVLSGVGSFGDDIGDIRNSTLVVEVDDPSALITLDQPIAEPSEEQEIVRATVAPTVLSAPVKQPIVALPEDLPEVNLEATIPVSETVVVKVEEDLNNPKPGPSKPKPASTRKNNKADAPKKTNAKKNVTDKKAKSDKNAKPDKKAQEDKAADNKVQQNKTMPDKKQQGKVLQGKVQERRAQQGKVQQDKNQKAPARSTKRAKEVAKKKQRGKKEQERCRCAYTKAKQRRHPKPHKSSKKCRGKVIKFKCRHKHSDSSSDSDTSDCCSVCSGEFCQSSSSSSSESCSCCDSTSSSCSCSCCEHSSDSDYDSSS